MSAKTLSAVEMAAAPLRAIDELIGIALRHHAGDKVRDLLGDALPRLVGAEADATATADGESSATSAATHHVDPCADREGSPDPTQHSSGLQQHLHSMGVVEKLCLMQEECRGALEELRDVAAAGNARLAEMSAELYATREAEQRASIEAGQLSDHLARGFLYVAGTPLIGAAVLDDDDAEAVAKAKPTRSPATAHHSSAALTSINARANSSGRNGNGGGVQRNTAAVFFEGTSFNDSMLDSLGLFLTRLPAVRSPIDQSARGDLYRPTTLDYEEMQELRWLPSEVALAANDGTDGQPVNAFRSSLPTRVVIGLNADTIMHKHASTDDKEAAVREQGSYCKGCLAPLKKSFNPLKGWDGAIFCHYSGYYYCDGGQCHRRNAVSPLPALIALEWDFSPRPISEPAKDFLEVHADSPIICISAINPQLYARVPILDAARRLRVEINALHAIGVHCRDYRSNFFECSRGGAHRRRLSSIGGFSWAGDGSNNTNLNGDGSGGGSSSSASSAIGGGFGMDMNSSRSPSGSRGGGIGRSGGGGGGGAGRGETGYETYVPFGERYLAMDSEFWSLNDLIALRSADPSNSFTLPSGWGEGGGGSMGASDQQQQQAAGSSASRLRSRSLAVQAYPGSTHPLDKLAPLCPLIRQLLEMRRQFLRHVVKECVDRCLPRAVHICPACQQSAGHQLVFAFDHHNRYYCKGCHCCYHAVCWEALGLRQGSPSGGAAPTCPVCFTIAQNRSKKPAAISPTASGAAKRRAEA